MESAENGTEETPLIEVGWLVAGRLDDVDLKATDQARERMLKEMRRSFPRFEWQMPMVRREDVALPAREEPVHLLDYGVSERDAKSWDFAFVITGADLVSHFRHYALAASSRSLDVTVISTSRIDPYGSGVPEEERRERLARRIYVLALHLFGHLNGLGHADSPEDLMHDLGCVPDLDRMRTYSPDEVQALEAALRQVADVRIEERGDGLGPVLFYLHAARVGWRGIVNAVRHAQPWTLPFRLSRLTTGACSALLILLMTAEAWDLGMSQDPRVIAALSLLALVTTTAYIVKRQRLLVRRGVGGLREQTAISNISVTLSILLGLLTTYAGLFLVVLALSLALYPEELVTDWAASREGEVALRHYLVLAGFIASLGIVIGSLGASFEEQQYFRHIAYVDEET